MTQTLITIWFALGRLPFALYCTLATLMSASLTLLVLVLLANDAWWLLPIFHCVFQNHQSASVFVGQWATFIFICVHFWIVPGCGRAMRRLFVTACASKTLKHCTQSPTDPPPSFLHPISWGWMRPGAVCAWKWTWSPCIPTRKTQYSTS